MMFLFLETVVSVLNHCASISFHSLTPIHEEEDHCLSNSDEKYDIKQNIVQDYNEEMSTSGNAHDNKMANMKNSDPYSLCEWNHSSEENMRDQTCHEKQRTCKNTSHVAVPASSSTSEDKKEITNADTDKQTLNTNARRLSSSHMALQHGSLKNDHRKYADQSAVVDSNKQYHAIKHAIKFQFKTIVSLIGEYAINYFGLFGHKNKKIEESVKWRYDGRLFVECMGLLKTKFSSTIDKYIRQPSANMDKLITIYRTIVKIDNSIYRLINRNRELDIVYFCLKEKRNEIRRILNSVMNSNLNDCENDLAQKYYHKLVCRLIELTYGSKNENSNEYLYYHFIVNNHSYTSRLLGRIHTMLHLNENMIKECPSIQRVEDKLDEFCVLFSKISELIDEINYCRKALHDRCNDLLVKMNYLGN